MKSTRFSPSRAKAMFADIAGSRVRLVGRLAEMVVPRALGAQDVTPIDGGVVGDFAITDASGLRFVVEVKSAGTSRGAWCPIKQLDAARELAMEDDVLGVLYAFLRWKNKYKADGVSTSVLQGCRTSVQVWRKVVERAEDIVLVDAEFLRELADTLKRKKGSSIPGVCYISENSMASNTRGKTLVLQSGFFSRMHRRGDEWTPNFVGLPNGWIHARGQSELRFDTRVAERLMLPARVARREMIETKVSVKPLARSVPVVALFSGSSARAVRSNEHLPMRTLLGMRHLPVPLVTESTPF